MINFILVLIAVVLLSILGTIAFVYSIFRSIIDGLSKYMLLTAKSFDQTGGVICMYLFNDLMVHSNGYRFGNPLETISEVLAINLFHFNEVRLYPLGLIVASIVNWFDFGARRRGSTHMIEAYDYWLSKQRK